MFPARCSAQFVNGLRSVEPHSFPYAVPNYVDQWAITHSKDYNYTKNGSPDVPGLNSKYEYMQVKVCDKCTDAFLWRTLGIQCIDSCTRFPVTIVYVNVLAHAHPLPHAL